MNLIMYSQIILKKRSHLEQHLQLDLWLLAKYKWVLKNLIILYSRFRDTALLADPFGPKQWWLIECENENGEQSLNRIQGSSRSRA